MNRATEGDRQSGRRRRNRRGPAPRSASSRGGWHRLRRAAHRLAFSDRGSGLVMLVFAVLGLVCANLPVVRPGLEWLRGVPIRIPLTNIRLSVGDWVQDGVLALFFLVVGLALKQELVTGSLSDPKRAAVPVIAAVGGMAAPPLVYLSVVSLMRAAGDPVALTPGSFNGWAVPTATDIAFSLSVLALFSRGLPSEIHSFLLTLATVDDLLGILLIAFVFTSVNQWYWFALMGVCALAWAWLCRLKRVPWPAVAVIGVVLWAMTYEAGIHPTLSGVIFGLLVPARPRFGEDGSRAERWHDRLQPWSALVALPLFAFFATSIPLKGIGPATFVSPIVLGICLALLIGKPLGVMAASWLSVHVFGLELAGGLKIRDLIGMACSCGIGFTVSFLIAALAFRNPAHIADARFAVLLGSFLSAILAAIVLTIQSRHPRERWTQGSILPSDGEEGEEEDGNRDDGKDVD